MILNLDSEIDRHKAQNHFKQLLNKRVVIELKERRPRSNSQNSYLHLIIGWFALEYGCSLDEAKQMYKRLNEEIYYKPEKKVTIGKTTFYIDKWRSSADLDSKEMTQSIDKFRTWSQTEADIYLPSPDDKRFLIEIDVQMSKNREYL